VSDIGRIGVRIYNNTGLEIRTAVVAYAFGAYSNSPGAEAAGITPDRRRQRQCGPSGRTTTMSFAQSDFAPFIAGGPDRLFGIVVPA